MTAYRIRACMGGQQVDTVVHAATSTAAILEVSELVSQGKVKIYDDGFTGNKRVHITYEELK
tara:strand:+ start:1813 stop:1998 length:186 start_codon:yes stop_codon:yes gene_type:complete